MTDRPEREPPSVTQRIEHDINIGALSPGGWLKQIDLERRYGCTRIEVRQALDSLAAKRLVTHVPNRGYHVSEFDARQVDDIYEVRAILEIAAAGQIVAHVTPEALRHLRRLAEAFEEAAYNGTLGEWNAANQAFHRAMLEHCPNRELAALIMEMRQRIPVAVQRRWGSQAHMLRSVRGHYEIVEAIERGDVTLLQAVIRDHVLANRPRAPAEKAIETAGAREPAVAEPAGGPRS